MKKRFALSRQTHGRELLVIAQHDESLNTRRAKWLSENTDRLWLRFGYEITRHGDGATLHYDVRGLVSLKSFVRRHVLDEIAFTRLLVGVQKVLEACGAQRMPTELVLFDPAFVFVDNQALPYFVLTPLDNVPFTVGNSPLSMLNLLGNPRKLSFTSPAAEMISAKLETFVLNQNNVFSANDFRTFMHDQCGIAGTQRQDTRNPVPIYTGTLGKSGETELRMWSGVGDQWQKPAFSVGSRRCMLERLRTGETYPLASGVQLGIGRGSKNAIQLTGNPKLSRNHVVIYCSGNTVSITDLGSANGTWINGRRLNPNVRVSISLGQRFSLANEELVIREGGS